MTTIRTPERTREFVRELFDMAMAQSPYAGRAANLWAVAQSGGRTGESDAEAAAWLRAVVALDAELLAEDMARLDAHVEAASTEQTRTPPG